MNAGSVTTQSAARVSSAETGADSAKPRKIVAYYLNPGCEHQWGKLSKGLQTLEAEGKTIWKCRTCGKITNTYDWQTP